MIGLTFNQYRITSSIGAGGMGMVFRAQDMRLKRDVAVKVLPKDFATNPDLFQRFEQEAKTLAALTHPNILTIHDAGVHDGAPYLVSELLEGKTLREMLSKGAHGLTVPVATELALQIANGLAAAHGKGVIHRDLKPENIFVCSDGRLKILDFGLAKLKIGKQKTAKAGTSGGRDQNDGASAAVTLVNTTEPGMVMGTPAYMSPEQVRAELSDHRSDIFAFGAVLYEMLSGSPAFQRDSSIETMNAVLNEEPPGLSNAGGSVALNRILRRCLEKSPDRRFQSTNDLAFALETLANSGTHSDRLTAFPETTKSQIRWPLYSAVAVVALSLAFFVSFSRSPAPSGAVEPANSPPPVLRMFEMSLPSTGGIGNVSLYPVISPDGRKLAYVNSDGLWLHSFDRIARPTLLAASTNIAEPFWSPESTDIGYFEGRKIQRVSIHGGTPVLLGHAPQEISGGAAGGAWLRGDRIIFATGWAGLLEVSAHGGKVSSVLEVRPEEGDADFHNPAPLPDGRGVLFVIHRVGQRIDTIALWTPDRQPKVLLQMPGGDFWRPVFAPSGHVLFHFGNRGLWAFPFSLETLDKLDEPFRVSDTGTFPSVANDGTLAFSLEDIDLFSPRQLAWYSRRGERLAQIGIPLPGLITPRISPDSQRVATIAGESWDQMDLWLFEVGGGGAIPFARNQERHAEPFWWNHGRSLLWTVHSENAERVSTKSLGGLGQEQTLFEGGAEAVSKNGQYILLRRRSPAGGTTLSYVSMNGGAPKIIPIPEQFQKIRFPALSPDDRWLAYHSQESGSTEVYLVEFPSFNFISKRVVSRGGGRNALWHPDGGSIFYLTMNGNALMSARLMENGAGTEEPSKVFDLPHSAHSGFVWMPNFYDISHDGERFLLLEKIPGNPLSSEPPKNLRVVLNWAEEFKNKK